MPRIYVPVGSVHLTNLTYAIRRRNEYPLEFQSDIDMTYNNISGIYECITIISKLRFSSILSNPLQLQ